MEIVKDMAGKNEAAHIQGQGKATVYVLNTSTATIEETIINNYGDLNLIVGLDKNDQRNGVGLHAMLWDAPPAKGEAPRQIETLHVVSLHPNSHGFGLKGVIIHAPSGIYVEFGTCVIMNMNPTNGQVHDIEIPQKEIIEAIEFFHFKDMEDALNCLRNIKANG